MNRITIAALALGLALFAGSAPAQSEPLRFEIEANGPITINGLELVPEGSMTTIGIEISISASGPPPADTTAPAAPENLVATPGDSTVALAWDANSEPDLAGYNVYRDSGGGFAMLAAAVLTNGYDDDAAVNGTSYDYYVTAYDEADNESAPSNEDNATPADTTAPDAPSAPTLTPGDTEIEVTLPSLSDDIVGFRVYTSLDDMSYSQDTATPQTSSWTITGLTNGVLVYVKISAEDEAANESALSAASSETPASAGPSDLGDLASGLLWYSPRTGDWTTTAGSPDVIDSMPNQLGSPAATASGALRPYVIPDHFDTGYHGIGVYTSDYLTAASAPGAIDDFSLVMVLDSLIAPSALNAYICNINASSAVDSSVCMYLQFSGSKVRVYLRDAGASNPIVTATTAINTGTDPIVVRVVRYRGTGSGDGYLRIYVNGSLEDEDTGLSLESWAGGNFYLGHGVASSNGAYAIGDTWLGTAEADGVLAEGLMMDRLGITP